MKILPLGLALSAVGLLSTAGCSAPATPAAPVSDPAPADPPVLRKPTTANNPPPKTKSTGIDPAYHVVDTGAQYQGSAPTVVVDAARKAQVPPPPLNMKIAAKPRVVLQTSKGPITLELDAKAAPLQVKSFVYLSNLHFFDGTKFHRHADLTGDGKGFIIQGGDPLTKNRDLAKDPNLAHFYGSGGPGYEIPREHNALTHTALVIAAARTSDPDSAGSQFYITQGPVGFLDQGDGYTVFGKVVDGKDAALKLSQDDTLKSAKVLK